ncbi:lytic transglycosylase domain-containing protein [Chryseobacterium chendengshani]|uniref:lytic transglycosylase domain-containing protein n=1 Tax=unclassified Chryseobacterium TaxID=2593645 RepID=UPI001C63F4B0|nr:MULTISPECIES: lytic transglycosylase domain-containing protein [unclassified Chryseobacterium]MBW7676733.1 lytic transglycosylase domain-containing protein [Chryseobacterium sp. LJ756]MBW8523276.1 lytic transglycosylase domain-containing protein [Chryseobacterium sp. LJ668]QYK15569.1 lytic transglycosylase domain-containing protein [Chryseobacterium sp. LJ668]
MKTYFGKIIFTTVFFISVHLSYAQYLSASDTSESSVRKYKNIINSNKEIVEFIEFTLAKKGLPKHLRNLALIESHFDRKITSNAGAVGVWQFMTAHANQYGLTEDRRSDLYRSTQVAAVSLANLYKKYNNWVTVVAAYNCGEGNIAKAMQTANSSQYHVFSKYLPAETINHVKKYLNACYATGELVSVLTNYNSSRMNKVFDARSGTKEGSSLSETEINAGFSLRIIAEELKIDVNEILAWNPGIEEELQNKGESMMYLPTDLMPDFLLRKNKILSRSVKEGVKPVSN